MRVSPGGCVPGGAVRPGERFCGPGPGGSVELFWRDREERPGCGEMFEVKEW